jgi:hypothetical protein
MIIVQEQMAAMDDVMMKRFVDKSIVFIRINFPDWSRDQSDEALVKFINKMITFARSYDIRKEINIQKVMEYKITFNFSIPLPPRLALLLNKNDLCEEARLELFVWQLEDTLPLIELTLEDSDEVAP